MGTFKKEKFNIDKDQNNVEFKYFYNNNLGELFDIHVSTSTTNGISTYVSFFEKGKTEKPFEMRHSDHVSNIQFGEVLDTAFAFKSNINSITPSFTVVNQVKKFFRHQTN